MTGSPAVRTLRWEDSVLGSRSCTQNIFFFNPLSCVKNLSRSGSRGQTLELLPSQVSALALESSRSESYWKKKK